MSQQVFIYHVHILNNAINSETVGIYKRVIKQCGISATSEYYMHCAQRFAMQHKSAVYLNGRWQTGTLYTQLMKLGNIKPS